MNKNFLITPKITTRLKRTFTRGKTTFTCQECGKLIRDTGRGEDGRYCWKCIAVLETDNSHIDGCHDNQPDPDCRMCKEEGKIS